MIRSILIPFDGSPASFTALSIACSISGIEKAALCGLFVEDEKRFSDLSLATAIAENLSGAPIVPQPLPPEEMLEVEEEVAREGSLLESEFRRVCEESEVEGSFSRRRGEPAEVIVDDAKRVDLVVIGKSGFATEKQPQTVSSTIEHLLRSTARPVLVVPDDAIGQSSIVIAYDGSRAAERALMIGAALAEICEIEEVHLISVGSKQSSLAELQQPAIEYLSHYPLKVVPVCREGKAAEVIAEYSQHCDASMIVLGAFGSNRFKELVFGSTTKQVLEHQETAVLLVS